MNGARWVGLAVMVLLLTGCVSEGRIGGSIITGGDHQIASGVVVDGHLVMIDGHLEVADGAAISGSAFVVGGDLRLEGRLAGDLTLLGGSADLGPAASVAGDVRLAGGNLRRDPAARVNGQVVTGIDAEAALGLVRAEDPTLLEQLIRFAIQLTGLLILAAFAARWLNAATHRIGDAIRRRTLLSVAVGMLAVLVGLPLVVFMAFTVVLIPLALILALGYGLVLAVAWVSLGRQVGVELHRRSGRASSTVLQAVAGTLVLTAAAGLLGLIPLVGDIVVITVLLTCIGAAVTTRLGMSAAPSR